MPAIGLFSIFLLRMRFADRKQAGEKLADALKKFGHPKGIVLGVPRGGVPVAYEVAEALGWPLEIILSKKIGHPMNPEYAIGAASLDDRIVRFEEGVTQQYVEAETERVRNRLREMLQLYMGGRTLSPVKGQTVIVVDDGIATGNTLLITVKMLKSQGASKIIVAAPCSSEGAWHKLHNEADDVVVLIHTDEFSGVGQFYDDFLPTEDEEVRQLLNRNYLERR